MKTSDEQVQTAVKSIESNDGYRLLANLYERWQDEKKYEDFDDYKKVIKDKMNYLDIVKVTSRPFGISFKVGLSVVTLNLSVKSRYIDFKLFV